MTTHSKKGEYTEPLWHAVLELTNRCNLRCKHCGSGSGTKRNNELSFTEWQRILEQLKTLGADNVTLMGGEIFLCADWFSIAHFAREIGLGVSIITNGLLLDSQRIEQILSLDLDILGISLDGADRKSYQAVRGVDGFDRVWRSMCDLQGKVDINAITTLSRANLDQVEPMIELTFAQGINWQVQFATIGTSRFDRKLFISPEEYEKVCLRIGEKMLDDGKDNRISTTDDFGYFPIDGQHHLLHFHWQGCQAGRHVIGIRSNGDILGCQSLGDQFVESNIREKSLVDVWRSPDSFEKLRQKTGKLLQGSCKTCSKADICGAGCSAMAHSSTGSIYENLHCLRRLETERILGDLLAS